MCGGALAWIAQESMWTGRLDLYTPGPGVPQSLWKEGCTPIHRLKFP